jgi:hypothetical protein
MVDKSVGPHHRPKGRAYCDTPHTYCFYGPDNICVNCGRKKGWRGNAGPRVVKYRVVRDLGVSSDLPVPQVVMDVECTEEVADALEGILPPEWSLEKHGR